MGAVDNINGGLFLGEDGKSYLKSQCPSNEKFGPAPKILDFRNGKMVQCGKAFTTQA